jgi:hypothetical protein
MLFRHHAGYGGTISGSEEPVEQIQQKDQPLEMPLGGHEREASHHQHS